MLREDQAFAANAARSLGDFQGYFGVSDGLRADFAALRRDFSGPAVAYQSACSLQHGQKITRQPKDLLVQCGFTVRDVPEAHLCCGSAGTYNILQPEIAAKLRERKAQNIERTGAGRDRDRQYRLHDPASPRDDDPGRAHRRAHRLGLRRSGAE